MFMFKNKIKILRLLVYGVYNNLRAIFTINIVEKDFFKFVFNIPIINRTRMSRPDG